MKRKGLPKLNELVFVTVNRVTAYAAWCSLDEFENVEGMIHISEVAGKWIYNIKDFVKEGKQYVAKVIAVDEQAKALRLSIKRVSKKDQKNKTNEHRKEARAEKVLEQIGKELGKSLEQAYDELGYKLIDDYGSLNSAFEEIKAGNTEDVSKKWLDVLMPMLEKVYKEKETELKVGFFIASYEGDGLEKVKKVMQELRDYTKANIKYVPNYKENYNFRIYIKTKDPKNVEKRLSEAMDKAIEQVKPDGEGSYRFLK